MHMITCKILSNGDLSPCNSNDRYLLLTSLDMTKPYKAKITQGRSLKSLGLYWLICTALAYYRDAGSKEWWSLEFKKMYFGYTEHTNPFNGKVSEQVQSVSFDSMDNIIFEQYLSWVKVKLAEIDIDWKQYIDEYKNRI